MVSLSVVCNGSIETWNWKEKFSSEEKDAFVKTYFLPYLNVAKFCRAETQSRGCFSDVTYKYYNGKDWRKIVEWNSDPSIIFADGSSVSFRFINNYLEQNNKAIDLYTDINGQRKPNKLGQDLHFFSFYPQTGEFFPYGIYENSSFNKETNSFKRVSVEQLRNDCEDRGWYCSALIVIDGFKMNY